MRLQQLKQAKLRRQQAETQPSPTPAPAPAPVVAPAQPVVPQHSPIIEERESKIVSEAPLGLPAGFFDNPPPGEVEEKPATAEIVKTSQDITIPTPEPQKKLSNKELFALVEEQEEKMFSQQEKEEGKKVIENIDKKSSGENTEDVLDKAFAEFNAEVNLGDDLNILRGNDEESDDDERDITGEIMLEKEKQKEEFMHLQKVTTGKVDNPPLLRIKKPKAKVHVSSDEDEDFDLFDWRCKGK